MANRLTEQLRSEALSGTHPSSTSALMLRAANVIDGIGTDLRRVLAGIDGVLPLVERLSADESDCTCDPLSNTGGGHSATCPEYEVECTCYEMIGGHQPMCPYGVMLQQKKSRANAG